MALITIPELDQTNVLLEIYSPTLADPVTQPATATISETIVEYDDASFFDLSGDAAAIVPVSLDIAQNTLSYEVILNFSGGFTDVDDATGFNGYVLTFEVLSSVLGVSVATPVLDDATNTLGISASNITSNGDSLLINVDGLLFSPNDAFEVEFYLQADGTSSDDLIIGSSADDILMGNNGNDTLFGGPGADTLNGGDGFDIVDYSDAEGRVIVDLQNDVSTRGFVRFFDEGAAEGDIYIGVEDAQGGGFADDLRGDATGNFLYGGGVSDRLYGRAGNDFLFGGPGADAFFGNLGADYMEGGSDAGRRDRYIYYSQQDSGVGSGNRDIIADFVSGEDRIEIGRLDADTTIGFNQAFDFIGDTPFSGTPGELGTRIEGGNTIVQADVDGDAIADFEIELTGEMQLVASDFIL